MTKKLIEVIYYGQENQTSTNYLYDNNELDIHLAELLYKISNLCVNQSIKKRMKKKGGGYNNV